MRPVALGLLGHFTALLFASAAAQADDAADIKGAERQFRLRCSTCHSLELKHSPTGPHLVGLFGRKAGSIEGYRFSKALSDSNVIWSEETLDAFIENPRGFIPGNRMMAPPIRKPDDRAAIIRYLKFKLSSDTE